VFQDFQNLRQVCVHAVSFYAYLEASNGGCCLKGAVTNQRPILKV